jgi:hypothetical protein
MTETALAPDAPGTPVEGNGLRGRTLGMGSPEDGDAFLGDRWPEARAVSDPLGGELSHASILLREAGKPAVVNCLGACRSLADGERVRLDGASGTVERLRR